MQAIINKLRNTTLKKKFIFIIVGLATITPIMLITVLSIAYYYVGIDKFFNTKISDAISQTVNVAQLYIKEHKQTIKSDVLSISANINRNLQLFYSDPSLFTPFLNAQAEARNLSEAIIFDENAILGKTLLSFSVVFENMEDFKLDSLREGDVRILEDVIEDRVRAITKLDNFTNTYLLIGRYVDPSIINLLDKSKGSAHLFEGMLKDKSLTERKLLLIFIFSFVTFSGLSIFAALKLAKIISEPVNSLVNATNSLNQGDFSVQLPEQDNSKDEVALLTKAFNIMTRKIGAQTKELQEVNAIIDERRRFIEAVLKEISSCVIVLDVNLKVTLFNYQGSQLFNIKVNDSIADLIPELLPYLENIIENGNKFSEINLSISQNNQKKHLFVRISVDENKPKRYILTIDDVSKLIDAQRSEAWADVARRIAHEIKNPLTPISLAAEQLQRKFQKQISSDEKTYLKYIDTITRNVSDIRSMVEEFVEFSRIPQAKMAVNEIVEIVNDVVFSQEILHKNIEYILDLPGDKCYTVCDRSQITRVLFNLIKNSIESINAAQISSGIIDVKIQSLESNYLITIADNGPGIDQTIIDKITEPYITTKSSGTGLGLSIVKKILEDHASKLSIQSSNSGASISFTLPKSQENQ